MSPQDFLNQLLRSRGYSTATYPTLSGGYHAQPTPLQVASYGVGLVSVVRASDPVRLARYLRRGLSPNPCNRFGESLLHMVCRRRDRACLSTLIEHGCEVRVSDDFGRTPLHDACWTSEPCFESVALLLDQDPRLVSMADRRGALPLAYVRKEHWGKWVDFFERKKDEYWPWRDAAKDGEESPPELSLMVPGSSTFPDPPNACSVEVAAQISSGQLQLS
eukprot:CAMPEP_0194270358 /NCGR_PEP_ID=MMETSP0169-20130528/4349_1 /TAXON_ID=218684 /ORGANISM="Corethron pennatum, Strain L29A3" /LENGTH=218 /DNA_ID=CAMNT_0039012369 /DNA_START=397 /DNA_END=1053 /DNA_ORIENTATION=+